MTTMQQLVVGVFRDHAQAEQAVNELLQAGFDQQQIRFAGQGSSTGGILEKIKSVFTGQDTSAGGAYNDLVNMGAPPEDARYYQSEFEAGHSIVAVTGTGSLQEATTILARHGGYGANQRFVESAANSDQRPGAQMPAREDVNADYNRGDLRQQEANQRFAQSANSDQRPGAQMPAREDVNADYNRGDLRQQGATSMQEPQQTSTSNTYYNLVSVLYHALEAEQTSATYVQDAQQSGDQDLAQFFSQVQQNASQQADRAKELLGRTGAAAR